jgi:hypothetical protein
MSDEDNNTGGAAIRPKVSDDAEDMDLYQKAMSHMQYRKQLEESRPEGCTFMPDTGLSKEFREKHTLKHQDMEVTQ